MRMMRLTDKLLFSLFSKEIDRSFQLLRENRVEEEYEVPSSRDVLRFDKYDKIVEEFLLKFERSFNDKEKKMMMHQLQSLRIDDNYHYAYSLGCYDSQNNIIYIHPSYFENFYFALKETLFHELLHMASTRRVRDSHISGFCLFDVLGINLDEGYTEYLT